MMLHTSLSCQEVYKIGLTGAGVVRSVGREYIALLLPPPYSISIKKLYSTKEFYAKLYIAVGEGGNCLGIQLCAVKMQLLVAAPLQGGSESKSFAFFLYLGPGVHCT
jgi:hypothetical protein